MRSDVLTLSIEAIEERLQTLPTPALGELGGLEALTSWSEVLSQSLYADRLVLVLAGAGDVLPDAAVEIVETILVNNPHPFVVAAVAQAVLGLELIPQQQRRLQRRLLERAGQRDTPIAALMASECLAGGLLLADLPGASRPAALAVLDELSAGEDPVLVRRGALLAGLGWLWSRSPDLEDLLVRLSADVEAGDQALFELALIRLDRALAADDASAMIDGLDAAARAFAAAAEAGPELVEAAALCQVLTAVTQFCSESHEDLDVALAEAIDAATTRTLELDRPALRGWLRPRLDVEAAWWALASALKGLTSQLARPSWLRAVPVLEQIATLRRAMVPLATSSGDRLRQTITERLGLSFLREEGLRGHLVAWRDDAATSAADRLEAAALLDAVASAAAARTASAATPSPLASHDQPLRSLVDLSTPRSFTGAMERAYDAMDQALMGHVDYAGPMRNDSRVVIAYLLFFLGHCLDMTPAMAKGGFDFLYSREEGMPLEVELQRACWHFLCLQTSGFPQHQVVRELPDVAGGRADIAIVRPEHRMVIEIKRELADASRDEIRAYLGQAATYQLTGPRIGFLVVLDLVSQRGWPLTLEDNCWVEEVQSANDSEPRIVCVWRIPGARQAPNTIVTPVQ